MLSLEHVRRLLGPDCNLSESQIERVRDDARTLAGFCIAAATRHRSSTLFQQATMLIAHDDRDGVEERAAIMEVDGKLTRERAEKLAVLDHVRPRR